MDIRNVFRLFKTGSQKKKTSFYLHQPIVDGIKLMAEKTGMSESDIVADVMDQWLTLLVESGAIPKPKPQDPIDDKKKTSSSVKVGA